MLLPFLFRGSHCPLRVAVRGWRPRGTAGRKGLAQSIRRQMTADPMPFARPDDGRFVVFANWAYFAWAAAMKAAPAKGGSQVSRIVPKPRSRPPGRGRLDGRDRG